MKYRTKTEIMSEILGIANGSATTKTKIMYRAFLSFTQMKKLLMVLTQNGLLSYDVDAQTFKTTEKGLRFLDTYNQIDGMTKALASSLQQQRQVYM
jgi:predicted transcriptional regulator